MNDHDDTTEALAELRVLAAEVEMEPTSWAQPPVGMWERIAAEAGVAPNGSGDDSDTAGTDLVDHTFIAPVMKLRRPSRRRVPWIVGAVAAVVALVVGVAVFVGRPAKTDVVASVTLDQLGPAGSGTAELIDDGGQYRLKVATADLDPGEGFLEVWVIDTEVSKLVSLGPARPDGTYDLPPGLDPEQFPVVDVSVEPLDGDPNHSGDSVLRGTLTF